PASKWPTPHRHHDPQATDRAAPRHTQSRFPASLLTHFFAAAVLAHATAQAQPELTEPVEVELDVDAAELESTLDPETREMLRQMREQERLFSQDPDDPQESQQEAPDFAERVSLPGDMQASASTPQAISLPTAEGSIQGMGESFSPVLSAGTGTYSVPIAVPAGRAGVQPSLSLAYGTSGGNSAVGFGWDMAVPFISRQTDRGLPRYLDHAEWTPEEDRFIYNGGQELVPVSDDSVFSLDDSTDKPAGCADWQQYRARVEGGFLRFFRSPNFQQWLVEGPDGSVLEFGYLPSNQLPSDFGPTTAALQTELGNGQGRIFRWYLTRMSDAHGSTVYYRYTEDEGNRYLRDLHYVSPASCATGDYVTQRPCAAPLAQYGRRISLQYGTRQDVFTSYVPGWRVATRLRLERIGITAAPGAPGSRTMVRRYHLTYQADSFYSLLSQVQVEGRPHALDGATGVYIGTDSITESAMEANPRPGSSVLPPMRFTYSSVAHPTTSSLPGFGGFDGSVITSPSSPPHS
ncbi:MAG: hypothetical protein K8H88_07540, partial [Sandaracinaceae bacterium]|nr:hypothetical protein [Sandaracinaceae bacterium]